MYRLEERDSLLPKSREMQRFSPFSQSSLSLAEQSRFSFHAYMSGAMRREEFHTFKEDESRRAGVGGGAFLFAGIEPRLSLLSETQAAPKGGDVLCVR